MEVDLINCVQTHLGEFLRPKCKEQGCLLRIDKLPNHTMIRGDKFGLIVRPNRQGRSCDCIVIIENEEGYLLSFIELKKKIRYKRRDPEYFVEKMIGSYKDLLAFLNSQRIPTDKSRFKCVFGVLAKSWDTSYKKKLAQTTFAVNSHPPYCIFAANSGCQLVDHLGDAREMFIPMPDE